MASALWRFLCAVAALAASGIRFMVSQLFALARRSRPAAAAVVLAACFVVLLAGSNLAHWNRAYGGISVGDVDVSGMTKTEIVNAVEERYAGPLSSGSVTVYASEEAKSSIQDSVAAAQDAALAEQLAVEEASANKQVWTADTASLSAQLPADELADAALAVGRTDGGILTRIGARLFGKEVPFSLSLDETALESLASDIDAAIGTPRVETSIQIEEGVASATEGSEGDIVDRDWLREQVTSALVAGEGQDASFVAEITHATPRVQLKQAQALCDQINDVIQDGATFTCEDVVWDVGREELGSWVGTRIVEDDDECRMVAYFDDAVAKPAILQNLEQVGEGGTPTVSFDVSDDGQVSVHAEGIASMPLVSQVVENMNVALFDAEPAHDGADGGGVEDPAEGPVTVSVGMGEVPDSLSFDEARESGIVEVVSSYTTEYTTGEGTENRNFNIHLVSDRLNNSVAKSGGGEWSYIDTAGECDEANGYKSAGAIVDGEYSDAIGGGVCQVATTVFNAVYEAGYPVSERHNHSLYIASYPAGRDAAVSWPDLDLVWENDADSDVLVQMSYTDSSVTCTLYGVSPGYVVTTEDGSWSEGDSYSTRVVVDESLGAGVVYLRQNGADGSSYWAVRTVTDAQGEVLHTDRFDSVYEPKDEIYAAGSAEAAASVGG